MWTKERQRIYNKKYQQTHREQRKVYMKKYHETHKEQSKQYYQKHKEKLREYARKYQRDHKKETREYRREHCLYQDGKTISGLNKRPYPNYCEICGRLKLRNLKYHHWDEEHLDKGMWVCQHCHQFAEGCDKGYGLVYQQKKKQIELEFGRNT